MGIVFIILDKKNCFDEYNYHDSLQACLKNWDWPLELKKTLKPKRN